MSEEILSLIKSGTQETGESQKTEEKATWLIFKIGNGEDEKSLYAIPAEQVKEILRDANVFPLPFVPPYVNGVLNRSGDPYVVIDSAVLEGKEAQNSLLFIVMNVHHLRFFLLCHFFWLGSFHLFWRTDFQG